LKAGDEIVLSIMEHHANIVPWHFLRERLGVVLKWVETELDGGLDPQKVIDAIGPKTKLVAVTHMSNVLGTVVDIKTIAAGAHAKGVPICVDGSQSAVHMPVDVVDLDVDFYAITGHKLYGPSASGAVYIKRERMAEMQPFIGGGDMIRDVGRDVIGDVARLCAIQARWAELVECAGECAGKRCDLFVYDRGGRASA